MKWKTHQNRGLGTVFVAGILVAGMAGCGAQSTDTIAAKTSSKETATTPSKGSAETGERVGAVGMLIDRPKTFEEFLTYDTLDAVVTGKVVSSKVLPVRSPADYPKTVVTLAVAKSSNPDHVKPGSEVLVRFKGARTTKGAVHKIFETKQKPDGTTEGNVVSPDDTTPVSFDMNGLVPPQAGDELLLFLKPQNKANGDRWVLSGNRGTYLRTAVSESRSAAEGEYSRAVEGSDGHLARVSVAKLNETINQIVSQRSTTNFKHKPL